MTNTEQPNEIRQRVNIPGLVHDLVYDLDNHIMRIESVPASQLEEVIDSNYGLSGSYDAFDITENRDGTLTIELNEEKIEEQGLTC